MRLVPLAYPARSLLVRWSPSLFSALGIALTVAVLGGVLALREGFQALLAETGRDDVAVYLRPGAQSEGESIVRYPQDANPLLARPEVAAGPGGAPLAASESYLGINLPKADGSGTAIVTVRGVEEASFAIQGDRLRILPGGRRFAFGADELIVGVPLSRRFRNCHVGDSIMFNVRPFKVVGLFDLKGSYASEIWGDVVQVTSATERPFRQRFVAELRPGTDLAAVNEQLKKEKLPLEAETERSYYRRQTTALGGVLLVLATILTSLMGMAAVLGAVNTMLAAVGARTREVGVLVALGYRGLAIFVSFLVEAAVIGAVGGALGCLLVLPLNGVETGTTNWNTFTEVAFAFRVTPALLGRAVGVAVVLGLLGGAFPAWRASRLSPTAALRRL